MLVEFQFAQPLLKIVETNKYYYCFICANEQESTDKDGNKVYLYDYNTFKLDKNDTETFAALNANPQNFLTYSPNVSLSLEEQVIQLKNQVSQLTHQLNTLINKEV